LCSRVIVFRHGSIFDELTGSDVDPVLILEAMFGHGRAAPRGEVPTPAGSAKVQTSPSWPMSPPPAQTAIAVHKVAPQAVTAEPLVNHPIKIRYF
jgi:hypothetical protein